MLLVRVLDLCLRLLREKESFHLLLLPLWKWEAGSPVAVLLRSSLKPAPPYMSHGLHENQSWSP